MLTAESANWLQQYTPWPLIYDFFSDAGGPVGWWVLLQFVVLFAGTRLGLRLAWMLCLAAYTNTLLKWLWAEPRPYWVNDSVTSLRTTGGFGMPSGHAQGAAAIWAGLWLVLRGHVLAVVVLVAIVFTALSRVYLGVHSPAQVLVGCAFGLCFTAVLWKLLPAIEARMRSTGTSVRALIALLAVGSLALLGWLVFKFREDFVAPADWLERFSASQQRLGQRVEAGEMDLVDGNSLILIALVAGYLVLAWVCAHWQHRVARSFRSRLYVVLLAVAINLATLALVRAAGAGSLSVGLWLVLQPALALWLPLLAFGQELPAGYGAAPATAPATKDYPN